MGVGSSVAVLLRCSKSSRQWQCNLYHSLTHFLTTYFRQAIAAATADWREFVAALEAEAKATDELCEAEEAEEALRHLRAKGSRDASLALESTEGATPENR